MNAGWVDPVVRDEHPELRLWTAGVAVSGGGRSGPEVQERLRALSDRWSGRQAKALRAKPIPHAYRVFFRHVGLDPDEDRIPVEALVLERLERGRFAPRDRVSDALTIAAMETGVGVWALDAETVSGELGVRPAAGGEPLGRRPEGPALPAGRLVIADDGGAVATLFGAVAGGHRPGATTRAIMLYAVQVAAVSMAHVDEALWIATETLED